MPLALSRAASPALLLMALCASCASFELEETFTVAEPLDSKGPVSLSVALDVGSIEVASDPSLEGLEVRGMVRLKGRDEESARARFEELGVSVERGAGEITVAPTFAGGRRTSERMSLKVMVPSLDGVKLRTTNGSLVVSGATGSVEADTSNGSIKLVGCSGDGQLSTSNGSIRLDGSSGDVRGTTGNGSVRVLDHGGTLDLDTSNGDVDVSLAEGCAGTVRLRTGNGSIDLSVASDWSGVIEASTTNGQVRFRDEDGLRQKGTASILAVGAGGARSVARTSNGSIEVEVREPRL